MPAGCSRRTEHDCFPGDKLRHRGSYGAVSLPGFTCASMATSTRFSPTIDRFPRSRRRYRTRCGCGHRCRSGIGSRVDAEKKKGSVTFHCRRVIRCVVQMPCWFLPVILVSSFARWLLRGFVSSLSAAYSSHSGFLSMSPGGRVRNICYRDRRGVRPDRYSVV